MRTLYNLGEREGNNLSSIGHGVDHFVYADHSPPICRAMGYVRLSRLPPPPCRPRRSRRAFKR